MYPASFRYYRPATLQEALSILQQEPEARPLAGGQSLIPAMKLRLMAPAALVDLGRLQDLRGMSREGGWWRIGAMTTHREMEFSGPPLLAEVAHVIADPAVRNRGTIGGSLAHADPAADYPAAILALEATIRAVGANGERTIPAHEFFQGMFTTSLMPGELITGIEVRELGPGWGWAYEKFPHPASGYAVVGVAAVVQVESRGGPPGAGRDHGGRRCPLPGHGRGRGPARQGGDVADGDRRCGGGLQPRPHGGGPLRFRPLPRPSMRGAGPPCHP
jgi:carbon-monoxide dehydrogenase medium subunit